MVSSEAYGSASSSAGVAAPPEGTSRFRARIGGLGSAALLALAVIRSLRHPRRWLRSAFAEMSRQGYEALPLVLLLTGLGGAVTSQQTGYQFVGGLPLWVIGSVVAASVITELAPILSGIALVGIVGARIAAEIGSMKATQQIDALEMMGRDPVEFLVVPRVVAGVVIAPLLVSFGLVFSLLAGWAVAVLVTPVSSADFWYGVRFYIRDFPFFFALIKGVAFGFSATFISCYVGLQAEEDSTGVGQATTGAVVAMMVALLILDALLAPLLKLVG